MMMRKKWMMTGCIFVLAAIVIQHSNIHTYIAQVKKIAGAASVVTIQRPAEDDLLLQRIKKEAGLLDSAPVDAKVDSVWKAIPGYNGLEVDVENTYRLSRGLRPDQPLQFVFKEIPARVHLDDLGPYPIYKGNPQKPMASLMINVAWGNEFIYPMLDVLEKENVLATFFFDGSWLSKNMQIARDIQSKGHEMANHAYSHPNMSKLSRSKATEEIIKTQQLLEKELGVFNSLFAPPSGDFNQETVLIAHELKLKTIMWTLDTVDWKNPPVQKIINKVNTKVEPGSFILMHPTQSSSQALQEMIRIIKSKGLQLGTVSEVLSPSRQIDFVFPLQL